MIAVVVSAKIRSCGIDPFARSTDHCKVIAIYVDLPDHLAESAGEAKAQWDVTFLNRGVNTAILEVIL